MYGDDLTLGWRTEAERLRATNDKLLAALEAVAPDRHRIYAHTLPFSECDFPECEDARAAIEEAKSA